MGCGVRPQAILAWYSGPTRVDCCSRLYMSSTWSSSAKPTRQLMPSPVDGRRALVDAHDGADLGLRVAILERDLLAAAEVGSIGSRRLREEAHRLPQVQVHPHLQDAAGIAISRSMIALSWNSSRPLARLAHRSALGRHPEGSRRLPLHLIESADVPRSDRGTEAALAERRIGPVNTNAVHRRSARS